LCLQSTSKEKQLSGRCCAEKKRKKIAVKNPEFLFISLLALGINLAAGRGNVEIAAQAIDGKELID